MVVSKITRGNDEEKTINETLRQEEELPREIQKESLE